MNETLTRKEFVKAILLGAGLSGVALVVGCGTQSDPQLEDQYTRNLYAGADSVYNIGSDAYWYATSHVKTVYNNVTVYTDTANLGLLDHIVICNKTTAMTVNLPAATGSKKQYEIENKGLGVVTVDGNGVDTIDGESTQELSQYEAITIVDYAAGLWAIY
jgi:hypothetical protein